MMLSLGKRRAETKVLHERIKVFFAVKQQETALHAASRNYGVDGFAHRNSQGSQGAEVPGGLNGNVPSSQVHHIQGSQQFSGHVEIAVARKALKHFGQDEIEGRASSTFHESV